MRINCGKKWKEAMTLVEVVIATGILSIMAAGLIGSYNYGFFVMELVRENQRATQILMEKVETIRLYNWTQVNTPGFIPSTFTDTFDPQGATGKQGITYNGTMRMGNVPFTTSYSSNLVQIQVTLTWSSRGSSRIDHTRSSTTYIARDGIQNYVY